MDEIERHEYIDRVKSLLSEREASPENPYWQTGDGADEGLSFCRGCIKLENSNAQLGEDYGGGYSCEEDGVAQCERCGKLLNYTLTDYGVDNELNHYTEGEWDWNHAEQCYEMARIACGIYSDEQEELFLIAVSKGINAPPELVQATERP